MRPTSSKAWCCRPPWRLKTRATTSATWSSRASSRIWTRPRRIQRSLLPQTLPAIPGYSVAFRSDTCYEVGGDYLDIVEQPDGSLLMVVADVAGKGLASAIMSTSFRAAFRGIAATGIPLGELALRMNQHHWTEGEEARRRYVTAIFMRLHPDASEIEVVNAGHNPGFLVEPGADGNTVVHQFDAAGTPLGLLPGMTLLERAAALCPRGAAALLHRRPHRGIQGR